VRIVAGKNTSFTICKEQTMKAHLYVAKMIEIVFSILGQMQFLAGIINGPVE